MNTPSLQDSTDVVSRAASNLVTRHADAPDVGIPSHSLEDADSLFLGPNRPSLGRSALGRRTKTGQPEITTRVLRFAGVAVLSTIAYVALYLGLRTVGSAQVANALALLVAAGSHTLADRRLVFDIRGRGTDAWQASHEMLAFGVALVLSAGSLFAAGVYDPTPSRLVEVVAVVMASLVATLLRAVLLTDWIIRRSAPATTS